jgi:hypothetical protein
MKPKYLSGFMDQETVGAKATDATVFLDPKLGLIRPDCFLNRIRYARARGMRLKVRRNEGNVTSWDWRPGPALPRVCLLAGYRLHPQRLDSLISIVKSQIPSIV